MYAGLAYLGVGEGQAAFGAVRALRAATAGGTAVAVADRATQCAVDGPVCFVAGTPVQMASVGGAGGTHRSAHPSRSLQARSARHRRVASSVKPIEQVQAGDLVLSREARTGRTEAKRVLRTVKRVTHEVIVLTLCSSKASQAVETITTTRNHPFYVAGKGFVPAGRLAVGNAIVTRAGPALIVKAIQSKRQAEGITVYNFEVEDNHNYFVGNTYASLLLYSGRGVGARTCW